MYKKLPYEGNQKARISLLTLLILQHRHYRLSIDVHIAMPPLCGFLVTLKYFKRLLYCSVSGNKVRACYHLCKRYAIESAFELYLASEITFSLLKLKNNVLHIVYHAQFYAVIIQQYVFTLKPSTIRMLRDDEVLDSGWSQRPDKSLRKFNSYRIKIVCCI